MPRKKKAEETYEVPQAPTELPTQPAPDKFVEAYRAAVFRADTRGRVSPFEPLYLPKGIRLSFRLSGSDLQASQDYRDALFNGWVPLPRELATTDLEEAQREDKVCLLAFEEGADGTVRVGSHVVMFKTEEAYMERYLADLRRLQTQAETRAEVYEDRSEEAEAAIEYGG